MLKLFNTLTKKKEVLKPLRKNEVRMYACGPTVYWFAHIGNMRAYIFVDTLVRVLKYNKLKTKFIMNITDVGHLTDDADAGEDKMIVAMRREGKTAKQISEFYTQAFLRDRDRLNILPPTKLVKATDHIKEQIAFVKKLEKNGFTYQTSDGVYFDTGKFPPYGRLSGQKAEEKKAGARVEMGEKKNLTDFALWKFSPKNNKREMEWPSPWGAGFPGWHIECSAMSAKYLGVPFDIHTGGVDHIPVHHENEIAQTYGAEGKLEANFWVHNNILTVADRKMSKSLGNLFTISELIEKGFSPLAFRFFVLSGHYRTKLNFTLDAFKASRSALDRLEDTVRDWKKPTKSAEEYIEKFVKIINDDLDTPKVLALVWSLVADKKVDSGIKAATMLEFDQVLGLGLKQIVAKPIKIPLEIRALVDKREKARQNKDWSESDRLRAQIQARGYQVEDSQDGVKVRARRLMC